MAGPVGIVAAVAKPHSAALICCAVPLLERGFH
jgi:hypothetical protein